jgi:hypothetical protein
MDIATTLKSHAARSDAMFAQILALQALTRVMVVRTATMGPAWQVTLADIREAASYDLQTLSVDVEDDRRGEAIRGAAQHALDACMADLRRAIVTFESCGRPEIGDPAFDKPRRPA